MTPIHPLQTDAWAQFRQSMGVVMDKVSNYYISFHKIPLTPFTVGYFPKGPLPTLQMTKQIKDIGKKHNAIYIQIEPNVKKQSNLQEVSPDYIPSHHPLFTKYTFVIDLSKSEEELLKEFHPKTRYNIKLAQKHQVITKEDNSNQAFETYLLLAKETTSRQRFYAHNELYQRNMWKYMHASGIAHLWTATYNNEVVAAWIVFINDGIMYYPYGASSRNHREVMAPNLLLWELIRWGKSHGIKAFDLWGALGPNPDEHDPWYGFHRFKLGYGPTLIEFVGSYDLVIKPFIYKTFCFVDSIRWSLLKLLK